MSKKPILALLIVLLVPSLITAGAWVKPKGGYYFKLSSNYMLTSKEFDHKGNEINYLGNNLVFDDTYFRDINIYFYYEYGITDNITIWGDAAYKSYTSKRKISTVYATTEEIATTSGFGDMRILGVYGFQFSPVAISLAAGPKIPLGYSKKPENNGPALGTGEIDIEAYLTIGASLYPLPSYLSTAIGYRKRGGRYNNEYYFNAETGYTWGDFFFKAYLELIRNTKVPPDLYGRTIVTPLPGGGGILPEITVGDQDISKFLPSITWFFRDGIGVLAELNHVFAGKNTLSGTTYTLGLVFFN